MIVRSHREIRSLVVHAGGLGDFLLFCPTLKRLREEGPVDLAGPYRDRLNLAVVCGIARTAHHIDDFDFASIFTKPSEIFGAFVSRYDRVVVWMNDETGVIATALRNAGVTDVQVFPGLPPGDWNRPASAYYGECFGHADLAPLRLSIDAEDCAHDVVVHPGSGGTRKNWPLENFAELARILEAQGRTITWVRGPAEEKVRLSEQSNTLEVASVITLARHLAGARTYIGNDSGVTHLAAACGCPTVAIFGPTDPRVWAPVGDNVIVVRGEPWVDVDEVRDAVDRL